MSNFEKEIKTEESSFENSEKNPGTKESLDNLISNLKNKINKLFGNFKSADKELEEIEKTVDLPPTEIADIKSEMKIEENVGSLNKEASRDVEESYLELACLSDEQGNEKIEEETDFYKLAEKKIQDNDFVAAKDFFLLISGKDKNLDQGALFEIYPEFRNFFESSQAQEAKKWLADEDNKIDSSFNPNIDVKNILKQTSGESRETALNNYKESLGKQTEASANITIWMGDLFKNKPEINKEDFLAELEKYGSKFSLPDAQMKNFFNAFQNFEQRKSLTEKLLAEFPDRKELFKEIFNAEPEGEIQVLSRGGTIAFRCENENDYLKIKTGDSFGVETDNSDGFFGFRPVETESGRQHASIIGEMVGKGMEDIKSYDFSPTLIHEEQHALKDLFDKPKYNAYMLSKEDILNSSPEIQKQEINRYLEYKAQKLSFDRAANEILAQFKGKPYNNRFVGDNIKGYDFYGKLAQGEKNFLQSKFSNTDLSDKISDYVDEYFSKNYQKVIDKSVEAVSNLYEFLNDSDKVNAILLNENLTNWPKIARRVIEEKNKF